MKQKNILVAVAAVIVLGASLYFYSASRNKEMPSGIAGEENPAAAPTEQKEAKENMAVENQNSPSEQPAAGTNVAQTPAPVAKTAQSAPATESAPVENSSAPVIQLKKYLMAFHACDTNKTSDCGDPRNHQTFLAQSDDGAAWSLLPNSRPLPGSVPSVIVRNQTIYIYNPGTVARYHLDTGTADPPIRVSLTAADSSSQIFVDPDPIIDSSGNLVLFYLPGLLGGDPAHCPPGSYSCTKTIKSATEVKGSDGTSFTVDAGDRASFSISGQEVASDPDVFKGPDGYVLYVSRAQSVEALSSSDLRGSYTDISTLPNGILVNNAGGVPAGYYDSASGEYWTYITSGITSVIRRAVSKSISSPLSSGDFQTVLSGSSSGLGSSFMVASPDVSLNK